MPRAGSPLAAVFGDKPSVPTRAWHRFIPWIAALALHGVLLAFATSAEPSLEVWSARMAATIHRDLTSQAPIAIEEPPPPIEIDPTEVEAPPEPAPEEPPSPPIPNRVHQRPASSPSALPSERSAPSEPAAAGNILAADEDPSAPVDLTEDAFVTGTASAYAGGATTRGGVRTAPPESDADSIAMAARPSLARPVRMSAGAWRCAWPASAISEDIYERFVMLRVIVGPDGRVQEASALEDPRGGFAEAAVACARRTRFLPALDDRGQPVRAASPPIRVRFTR